MACNRLQGCTSVTGLLARSFATFAAAIGGLFKRLAENSFVQVRWHCGCGDVGNWRRVFAGITAVTPGVRRQRFVLGASLKQWPGQRIMLLE